MTRDEARRLLAEAGVPDPATDVRRLWDFAFLSVGEKVGKQSDAAPNDLTLSAFKSAIEARIMRKPVSQIVGGRHFWKGWFAVTPDVLDPRPETETLIDLCLQEKFSRVLDLGTGSGCILISLLMEAPDATGVGTDISAEAVLVAGRNAAFHKVADRLILPLSDWYDDIGGRFDLIVSNPPYIAASEMDALQPEVRDHEPRMALTDGGDGLSAYRAIAAGAGQHLSANGRLLVEIGANQAKDVATIFNAAGLENVTIHKDLSGKDRVVSACASGHEN